MSGAPGSRFWGVVTTLGLTGAAMFFLFGVMEESSGGATRRSTPS